jgi:uncharacterized protein (TIGR03118 family)
MLRRSKSRVLACALAVAAVGVASTSVAMAHQRDEGRNHAKQHGDGEHGDHHGRGDGVDRAGIHFGPGYTVTARTSDTGGGMVKPDKNLINGWGISAGPATPWWVSNNGTNTSTLYTGDGTPQALVVGVPGGPTGTVFNGGTGFSVMSGGKSVPSLFIFATQAGTIEGWPPPPPLPPVTASVTAIPAAGNAIFTGLAISADYSTLYAADFANGKVDVWDSTWAPVSAPGAFTDPYLNPSQHYGPFGIQQANGSIFVTYAKQSDTPGEEVHGRGLGIVDEYSPTGAFIGRVGSFGDLNSPWGVAWAPAAGFGTHEGELLVGNFGDGRISTFVKLPSGRWLADDQLRDANGHRIAIDGLWGIGFGNGGKSGLTTSLYFAAGPDEETHGLFGTVIANS